MLVIGIDPGISGSICFFKDGKIFDVIEMPKMAEGKKNKRQVNGAQIYNEISSRIKNFNKEDIKVDKKEISDEKIFELAIESGADECISNDNFHEIHCDKTEIYNIKKKLETKILNFISTEIEWRPLNNIVITKSKLDNVNELLENLEDDEDVQKVFTNLKIENN